MTPPGVVELLDGGNGGGGEKGGEMLRFYSRVINTLGLGVSKYVRLDWGFPQGFC